MISNIIAGALLFILHLILPLHPFRNLLSNNTNVAFITAADAFVLSSTTTRTTASRSSSTMPGIGSRHLGSSFGGIPKKSQSKRNSDEMRGISSSSPKSRRPRFVASTTLFLSSTDNGSFTFQMASASVAGSDPDSPGKVNQDACFHFATTLCKANKYPKSSPFYICGGVLDGHGKKGHVLNQFLGEHLPRILEKKLHKENEDAISIAGTGGDSMENILIDTFHQAHNAARKNETVPAARSGTTCVTCVVDALSGIVYTANVGDSRAILILQNPQWTSPSQEEVDSMEQQHQQQQQEWDSKKKSKYKVIPLSRETTTKDANERKRIEETEQGRIDGNGNVW
jgi:Serine/threonine protein phosphatase